jgi:hypothetical protein
VNRCASETRSISTAIASIACSIRSSRATTSDGTRGCCPCASMRRAHARAIGRPIAMIGAHAIATMGTRNGSAITGPPASRS